MRILRLCAEVTLICVLICALTLAAPSNAFYFLDPAGVLREETKRNIYAANQLLEEACGAQIAIVVLEDIGGASIEKYATSMRDLWGVGDAEKKNGFLLLVTVANEEYYTAIGHGLESIFPQDEITRLLDEYFVPEFTAGDCDAGVQKLFGAVFGRVADFYGLEVAAAEPPFENSTEDSVSFKAAFFGALFAAFAVAWLFLNRRKHNAQRC